MSAKDQRNTQKTKEREKATSPLMGKMRRMRSWVSVTNRHITLMPPHASKNSGAKGTRLRQFQCRCGIAVVPGQPWLRRGGQFAGVL